MSVRQRPSTGRPSEAQSEVIAERVVPVIEERLTVQKRFVESGGAVRIRKVIHSEVVKVDEPLRVEEVEVDRVVLGPRD